MPSNFCGPPPLKPTANVDEGMRGPGCLWPMCSRPASRTKRSRPIKQAAALQPKDPEPHLSAGLLLEKENRFADAEQEYKQALAIDPASTEALTGLANIYMRGQHFAEAEQMLRKIIACIRRMRRRACNSAACWLRGKE